MYTYVNKQRPDPEWREFVPQKTRLVSRQKEAYRCARGNDTLCVTLSEFCNLTVPWDHPLGHPEGRPALQDAARGRQA